MLLISIRLEYNMKCWSGPPYKNVAETTLFDEIWSWEINMKSLHGGWHIYHPGFT